MKEPKPPYPSKLDLPKIEPPKLKLPKLLEIKLPKLPEIKPPKLPKPPKDLPPVVAAILAAAVTAPTAVMGGRLVKQKQAEAAKVAAPAAKADAKPADAPAKDEAKEDEPAPNVAPLPPLKKGDLQIVRLVRWTPGGKTPSDVATAHDKDNEDAETAFRKRVKGLIDDGYKPFSTTASTLNDADPEGFSRTTSEVWLSKAG